MATNTSVNQPINKNFLGVNKWSFVTGRLKTVPYFINTCAIPGLSSTPVTQANPFGATIGRVGKKASFSPLVLNFYVDEDLKGWEEIYLWLAGNSSAVQFEDFSRESRKGEYAEGILELNTNNHTSNLRLKFFNMFPISLGEIRLSYQEDAETTLSYDVTFQYDYYALDRISA